ncbi:MAG TPA: glycosyltransferase [Vicinamibacterales bacterium]|jgi:glycosyltransferase involved in cell wall biosynthesis
MRVLHVSPYFAPAFVYGGPPRSILGLCRGLQANGVDVDVVTTTANGRQPELLPSAERSRYNDVPVRYFALDTPRRLWNSPQLRNTLLDEVPSYDLVHIHGLWHRPGWDAARIARLHTVPYVISPRGMLEDAALSVHSFRKRVAWRLVEQRNVQNASWIHATSPAEARTLERGAFGPATVLAPNGVDADALRSADPSATLKRFNLREAEKFVLYLGRVHPIKRLDLLADAIGRRRGAPTRVVVAGPDDGGYRDTIAPRFAAAGGDVVWTGPVDGQEKADLLNAATVLVMCSDSESFGLSVAEAMAVGVPVVVTRTCPWEEVEQAGAGRWVPQNADALAAALDQILGNEELARSMGLRGRELMTRRYTLTATARIIAERYRDTIGGRRMARTV